MILDCAVYENGRRRTGEVDLHAAYAACRDDGAFVWVGMYEPTAAELDSVRREFNLHELAVEDALNAHQRPKVEVYGESLFVVLKTARYVDPEEVVELGEIQIFLGDGFAVTVRHGSAAPLSEVRRRVESDPDYLRLGAGAVLHAVLDHVVDGYAPAIEGLANDVEEIEAEVFSESRAPRTRRIYELKREVLEFARAVTPLMEPLDRLAAGGYPLVHPEIRAYFRDVTDHLTRAHEQLEGFRELLTSVLEANLTQVSVRQNEDMRRISAWVAIAAVPTMIAGIYGMNFQNMPELRWQLGYPAVIALMAVICGTLYWRFKRAGWL